MDANFSPFVAPGSGPKLGPGITWKVPAAATGGSVSLFEGILPPGMIVPPHVHEHEDECTCVLDGELVFRVGGAQFVASAGAHVVKPRGTPHAFWNLGARPARVLEIVAPGNLDGYFREFAALLSRRDLVEGDRRAAMDVLQARHGIRTDWGAAAALFAEVGLAQP